MHDEIQSDKPAGCCQPQLLFAAVKDRTKEERTTEDESRLAALPSTYFPAWMANPPHDQNLTKNNTALYGL